METLKIPKILVVDDEYANLFFMRKILINEGFDAFTASGAKEALDILSEIKPDAILLDIMMPDISGIDLLKILQENNDTKEIPIIMVTAKTDSSDVESALSLGAIEYIKKPVDEIELLARIKTILRIKDYENQLKENIKAKEEFINIVAHDLRTPFITISGFTDIIKKDKKLLKVLTDEHKEILNYVSLTSTFIIEYFNKLLHWSKLGSQSLILNRSLDSLRQIVDNTYTIYKPRIDEKKLEVIFENIDRYKIYFDEIYFAQVFSNIFANAIKFTPDNGKIIVSLERDENMTTILTIKDTGIGMTEEIISRIFSDFPVIPGRGIRGEKGLGLGLKICRKIIDSHKFKMTIESEIDQGTTIKIFMPPKELCN